MNGKALTNDTVSMKILDLLNDGLRRPTKGISIVLGIPYDTVTTIVTKLRKKGQIERAGKGEYRIVEKWINNYRRAL